MTPATAIKKIVSNNERNTNSNSSYPKSFYKVGHVNSIRNNIINEVYTRECITKNKIKIAKSDHLPIN
jgi:hypothetical protein